MYKLQDFIDSDKLDWSILSRNKNAIHLLENNFDKINWCNLSLNLSAIHILEKNIDKINWYYLSRNKNAIDLLKNNMDKIDFGNLSYNQNIFTYDYSKIKEHMMNTIYEELISTVLNPERLMRISKRFNIEFIDLVKMY